MDYDSLRKAGSSLGSGAVIVMDETTCMVRVLRAPLAFLHAESCGQCTPCREGTGWLDRMLKRILAGQGRRPTSTCWWTSPTDRGPHHLRARRCGGLAGAELHQALPARVRIHDRARPQHRRRRVGRASVMRSKRHERRTGQHRGRRRAGARRARAR